MKSYDLVFVIRPDLEQDASKTLVDRVTQRITDQGGTVEAVDTWGKRRMSFSLKKNREGLFIHTRFSLDPAKVAEVRRGVNLIEEVLRFTLTNAVGKTPEPKSAEVPAPAAPVPVTPTEPPAPTTPSAAGA
ncbi:MAG TPA: 30S ribosomal protein S6 [bacterium]|nr:30S ribosomal protein S6 [bacterium]